MPTIEVYNIEGQKVSEVMLSDEVFASEIKPYLLHEAVIWQMSNHRLATAKTKSRSEVSGGGKKPWKQKGTGRARVGTIRSPLWKGGGVVFGPNGRTYGKKLPKKVREAALKSALSMKAMGEGLKIVDKVTLAESKTKRFVHALKALGMENALVVMGDMTIEVSQASRNVNSSKVLDVKGLNVYDILKYKGLILDLEAVKFIEARLSR
jgi:large subunit ribosomal protein L4